MAISYCVCPPRDGKLYVEVPSFRSLLNLLITQQFRDVAHFRTIDGSVPYFGGGIAFPFIYLRMLGVQPLWYRREGFSEAEVLRELVEDNIFASEHEASEYDGHFYKDECEWQGPRRMRFDKALIEEVWIGPIRDRRAIDDRHQELRQFLPEHIPIFLEAPEPTGIKPCK